MDMVTCYMQFVEKTGYLYRKRNDQAKYWMYESINESLKTSFYTNPKISRMLPDYEQRVLNNEISSFVAARQLLDSYLG